MTPRCSFLERPILAGQVNFPVLLAPMVGLSHIALRLLVRDYLPAGAATVWPTEMLSTWRLPKEDVGRTPETLRAPGEDGLVPQILGNEEGPIRDSVRLLGAWGAAGIDINMGCPVKKALRHNYGVALMGDADYAARVVAMTARHAGVPVSVKLRAGLQSDTDYLRTFVRGLAGAGAAWLTLHPRIGAQKRRGTADWSQIRLVRDTVAVPVIGNGDAQCAEDVFAMHAASGCDAVMVGRALAARPWLMWQVGERLGFAPPPGRSCGERAPATREEEGAEYGRALLRLMDLLEASFDAEGALKRLRFHVRMTCGWLEFGHALFAALAKAPALPQARAAVSAFFAVSQRMSARTQLRD